MKLCILVKNRERNCTYFPSVENETVHTCQEQRAHIFGRQRITCYSNISANLNVLIYEKQMYAMNQWSRWILLMKRQSAPSRHWMKSLRRKSIYKVHFCLEYLKDCAPPLMCVYSTCFWTYVFVPQIVIYFLSILLDISLFVLKNTVHFRPELINYHVLVALYKLAGR
jgi:hypothetical protein